jgi:hypothetical protein
LNQEDVSVLSDGSVITFDSQASWAHYKIEHRSEFKVQEAMKASKLEQGIAFYQNGHFLW